MDKGALAWILKGTKRTAKEILGNQKKQEELLQDAANFLAENRNSLRDYWQAIAILFALLKDYFIGEYDKIPLTSVGLVVGSLVYVVSPLKVVPKWMPFSYFLDRSLVIVFVLEIVKDDIVAYSQWKLALDV